MTDLVQYAREIVALVPQNWPSDADSQRSGAQSPGSAPPPAASKTAVAELSATHATTLSMRPSTPSRPG